MVDHINSGDSIDSDKLLNPRKNTSTYMINPEAAEETGRLLLQDRLLNKEMGGYFPPDLDMTRTHVILDLACGPGGWSLDVARAYPRVDVIGVDLSQKMIRYAQAQAEALGLDNASFRVMDIVKPLDFPDDAFEFVNVRFISSFMPREAWPRLVQECIRVTRSGGILRFTDGETNFTNGKASEHLNTMIKRAMWLDGKSFGVEGGMHGITLMLAQFLRNAGLLNVKHQAYALEYSFGTEAYETYYQNLMMALPLVAPWLIKLHMTTQEEFARLSEDISYEMQEASFRGLLFFLSVWGIKPEGV